MTEGDIACGSRIKIECDLLDAIAEVRNCERSNQASDDNQCLPHRLEASGNTSTRPAAEAGLFDSPNCSSASLA